MGLTNEAIALLKDLSAEGVLSLEAGSSRRALADVLAEQGLLRSPGAEDGDRQRRYVLSGRGLRLARTPVRLEA